MYLFIKFLIQNIPRNILIRISNFFIPIFCIFFRGKKFLDPINNKKYRYFFSYGHTIKRYNALSPGTFSLERHRFMWLYLINYTNFFHKKNKLLHVSPELCLYNVFSKMSNIKYYTVDLNLYLAKYKLDLCNMKLFKDNYFDVIICNHVLEHLHDDIKAIKEIYRVMKNGAWGIVQVPLNEIYFTIEGGIYMDHKDRTTNMGQYDHLRLYGKDIVNIFKDNGFRIDILKCNDILSIDVIQRCSLNKNEYILLIKK